MLDSNVSIKRICDWEIETPDGFVPFAGVAKVNDPMTIIKFYLEDGNSIEVSYEHLFVVDGIEQKACDFIEGECLETKNGFVKILKIEINEKDFVYDVLEVESENNLYYANGIVNHNCKFLGSSNTLIDGELLESIDVKDPITTKWNGLLYVYELPKRGESYILGVDSSKGTGLDYSVIQVIKINNENSLQQVAVYRYNRISPHDYAQICISISEFYNDAYMMIENNDVGSTVADTIWYEYECDRIVNCDPKGLGIRSTRSSKLSANMLLKRYMESGWLDLCDSRTLYELSKYKEITPNVFQCGREDHDDTVTSLLWAVYFVTTPYFDGKSFDVKSIEDKYKIDENEFDGPIMIFDE